MKDAQKPDHVSLMILVNRLREGRFVIPDFQREFERKPWDISELMRSIFLDYFIGSLLLCKEKKISSSPSPASPYMASRDKAPLNTSCCTDSSVSQPRRFGTESWRRSSR